MRASAVGAGRWSHLSATAGEAGLLLLPEFLSPLCTTSARKTATNTRDCAEFSLVPDAESAAEPIAIPSTNACTASPKVSGYARCWSSAFTAPVWAADRARVSCATPSVLSRSPSSTSNSTVDKGAWLLPSRKVGAWVESWRSMTSMKANPLKRESAIADRGAWDETMPDTPLPVHE